MKVNSDYLSFEALVAAFSLKKVGKLPSKYKKRDELLGQIFCLGGSNAGFDSLIFLEDDAQKLVLLLISSKFSEGEAIQEIGELKDGHEKSMAAVEKHWPVEDIASRVYFVANCWRNNRAHQECHIPENSIILERNELKELYGSLSQRPQLGFKYIQANIQGKMNISEEDIRSVKREIDDLPEREDLPKKRKIKQGGNY